MPSKVHEPHSPATCQGDPRAAAAPQGAAALPSPVTRSHSSDRRPPTQDTTQPMGPSSVTGQHSRRHTHNIPDLDIGIGKKSKTWSSLRPPGFRQPTRVTVRYGRGRGAVGDWGRGRRGWASSHGNHKIVITLSHNSRNTLPSTNNFINLVNLASHGILVVCYTKF